jgi:hypothetical protein
MCICAGLFFFKERSSYMGKNLKGRECGKGICQRKDGKYSARYCAKDGSRREKHFDTLPEARNWLADSQYEDKHSGYGTAVLPKDSTADDWFEYWMENLVCGLAPNTRRNYKERYIQNIQPVIGCMLLSEVKPMHCKVVWKRNMPVPLSDKPLLQWGPCFGQQ